MNSPVVEEKLSLYDAVRLLRDDVKAIFSSGVPGTDQAGEFLLWWVLTGRHEYDHANDCCLTGAQRKWLFEPIGNVAPAKGIGVNRLLYCLLIRRSDLRLSFDMNSPVGVWDAIAWLYLTGIRELKLEPFLDDLTSAALRAPIKEGEEYQPSLIMFLLWRQQHRLQITFNLETVENRARYHDWFLKEGVRQFGLQAVAFSKPCTALVPHEIVRVRPTFGVNLIGFAFGELGIGEDLRMAAQALTSSGVPFKILNIDPGNMLRQTDRLVAEHVVDAADHLPYSINLFCLTGFDTVRVYADFGDAVFNGRHNIGWWPWELPVWPKRWVSAFMVIDEVWAATSFTKRMFERTTKKKVVHMPLPVSVQRLEKTSRRTLGLPAKRFLFLYVFDFNSYLARKNPWAAIEAFQRAFPVGDKSVGLVLKTMNSRADNPQWDDFTRLCAADPRITLLQTTLDRGVVLGLVDSCDAYVSLHRSEGFGRTLAEAMLLGKPVVGTGFSGNADFLTTETGYPVKWKKRKVAEGEYAFVEPSDAAWWAEPDIAHAARQMRAARESAGSEWANQLPQQVEEMFSPAHIGARMAGVLKERFAALE